jgi:peptidylprolyl isomerase
MRRRLAVASVAALAITGLAACGGSDSDSDDAGDEAAETTTASLSEDPIEGLEVTGEFGEEPKVAVDGLDVTELESSLVIAGDGDTVPADGTLLVQSLFANGADGKTLSSSFTQEAPQRVALAQTQDYFKDTLTDAKVGSRVALAMPAQDYFGQEPPEGSGVTAEDDIVIVLDVVELADPPLDGPEGEEVDPPADAPKPQTEDGNVTGVDFSDAPEKAPTELQVIPLIEGEGAKVKENDSVTVDYYGVVWGGDEAFDESFSKEPANFTLAQGQLIDGWVEGLQGVTVGSRVMIVVPPAQGYGDQAQGNIPAGSTLVFVVDVLGAGS